jgi:hypothetical protein
MLQTDWDSAALVHKRDTVQAFWRSVAMTTSPADVERANAAVALAYKAAGLPPPAVIIWLGSPRAAYTAVKLLRSNIEWPEDLSEFQRGVWHSVWKQCVRQIEAHMGADKWAEIRGGIKRRAVNEIESKYGQYIEKQVKAIFAERMGIEAWKYLRRIVGNSRIDDVRSEIELRVKKRVAEQLSEHERDQIYQVMVPSLRQQYWSSVVEPLRIAIAANNGILQSLPTWDCSYGLHDADWMSYYDYLQQAGVKGIEPLDGMKELAKSCGWWWPFDGICIVTERPTELHRDNRGRLHHEERAAIRYPDGWGLYAWNGILVPEDVIVLDEPISFERIESETNAEIRRVLIERFGLDNYLRAGKCIKLHSDETGTLYRMNLPGDEPILVVQVINSTAEPDGSFNEYFLRVPPHITRARQGVAWTFGLSEAEYYPLAET